MDNDTLSRLSALRARTKDLSAADRQEALKLAEETIQELESPEQRIMRHTYQVCHLRLLIVI
jgi:hypothetical protein